MLLKMLWDKKLAVYFLLGFILVSYLGLPMVGVAAFGIVVVVVTSLRDKEVFDLEKAKGTIDVADGASPAISKSDEEAFFACLVGGTMGVGKMIICKILAGDLPNSVFVTAIGAGTYIRSA